LARCLLRPTLSSPVFPFLMNFSLLGACQIRRCLSLFIVAVLSVLGFAYAQDAPVPADSESAEKIAQSRKAGEEAAKAFKGQPAQPKPETIEPAKPVAPSEAAPAQERPKGANAKSGPNRPKSPRPNRPKSGEAKDANAQATPKGPNKSKGESKGPERAKAANESKGPKGPNGQKGPGKSNESKGSKTASTEKAKGSTPNKGDVSASQGAPATALSNAPEQGKEAGVDDAGEVKSQAKDEEANGEQSAASGMKAPFRKLLDQIDLNSKAKTIEDTMTPIANQLNDVVFSGLLLSDNGDKNDLDENGDPKRKPLVTNCSSLASREFYRAHFHLSVYQYSEPAAGNQHGAWKILLTKRPRRN